MFVGFSSTAKMTPSLLQTPIAKVPLFTVSMAYSTWYILPSGEYIVGVISYPRDAIMISRVHSQVNLRVIVLPEYNVEKIWK